MKAEHTPGPWLAKSKTYKLSGTDKATEYHVYSNHDFICTTYAPHDLLINALEHEAVCKSNARLIAAAPELLEALEALYMSEYAGNSTSLEDAINRSSKTDEFEQKIVKAIKKARGL